MSENGDKFMASAQLSDFLQGASLHLQHGLAGGSQGEAAKLIPSLPFREIIQIDKRAICPLTEIDLVKLIRDP